MLSLNRIINFIILIFLSVFTFGQITFVDVVPDSCVCVTSIASVSNSVTTNWDLDNDATIDFKIESLTNYADCTHGWATTALKATGTNMIAGDVPTGYNSAFMLNYGDTINNQPSWLSNSWLRYYDLFSGFQGTHWITPAGIFKYVGIKFYSGTTLYYGWVRLNVTVSCGLAKVLVTEYAYSTSLIKAGEGALASVKEYKDNKNSLLYPNPNNGFFKITSENSSKVRNVLIKNILGQEVALFNAPQIEYDVTGLDKGIYFVFVNFFDHIESYKVSVE